MIYCTHTPAYPLNEFITHFTYYKDHTPGHSIDRFLPNGNIEIVIDLTGAPKFIYDNDTLQEKQACNKLWLSGIRNGFITIPSGQGSEMFVLNFKKGMVAPFLNMPLCEITDHVIDGDLVLPEVFLQLRNMLLDCKTTVDKFKTAEQLLIRSYINVLQINPVIAYAVNAIIAAPEVTVIKKIADKTGYSSKHLVHLFKTRVGVAPKTFLRIMRFQKAIREMERKGNINFASLAVDCGYYDQSHFIADFKSFSGFTPVHYASQQTEYSDYVPVR